MFCFSCIELLQKEKRENLYEKAKMRETPVVNLYKSINIVDLCEIEWGKVRVYRKENTCVTNVLIDLHMSLRKYTIKICR